MKVLTENNEDFEWYPTTDEILECVRLDIFNIHKIEKYRFSRRDEGINYDDNNFREREASILHLDSFLDIGAGDGRVFDRITKEVNRKRVKINERYGIEKATVQGDDLIKNGVALIGRDYFETVLIDRSFSVVFSNPPYSRYKEWTIKLLKEVNAKFIYLVLPIRWHLDADLVQLFDTVGLTETIGTYDFTDGDRSARAKVDVIKVTVSDEHETFRSWVEENLGRFETNENIDLGEGEEDPDLTNKDRLTKIKPEAPEQPFFTDNTKEIRSDDISIPVKINDQLVDNLYFNIAFLVSSPSEEVINNAKDMLTNYTKNYKKD